MSADKPRYWMTLAERDGVVATGDEFAEPLPVGPEPLVTLNHSRRDFFRMMGLSAAATATACRRAPVKRAIPYLVGVDSTTPGVATWYASTCGACPAACGILIKTREGRPIKIEGNPEHPLSRGGLCAIGQASVLSLYDAARLGGPRDGESTTSWSALDAAVTAGLTAATASGRGIRLVAPTRLGPTSEAVIAAFLAAHPGSRRVGFTALGEHVVAEAHAISHGVRAIPSYAFDRARVIVGFDADFLGTWVSPVQFTKAYVAGRRLGERRMSRHIQIEPQLTVTGAAADTRWTLAPHDLMPALRALASELGVQVGAAPAPDLASTRITSLARELRAAKGEALVVCGSREPIAQLLTNAINEALGNYGGTLDLASSVAWPESQSLDDFVSEASTGAIAVAIFVGAGVNPVFASGRGTELAAALGNVEVTVSCADRRDETASGCRWLAPDHHYLEAWNDAEPKRGVVSLAQPSVAPLYETRDARESLAVWAGLGNSTAYDRIKSRWQSEVLPHAASVAPTFTGFWDQAVQRGLASYRAEPLPYAYQAERVTEVLANFPAPALPGAGELELAITPSVSLRDGSLGNNAWLLELPDPVSKVSWTNVAALAPDTAQRLGIGDGDVVTVTADGANCELPALVQPGVAANTVALTLGFGRSRAGSMGNGKGDNAFKLIGKRVATVRATGRNVDVPRTQTHSSTEGRDLIREADLTDFLRDERAGNQQAQVNPSMWPKYEYPGHRWAMAIDLTSCTGCSACLVACQAENNIPAVGADEVRRRREMHWLRIDRYYQGDPDEPAVVLQPMLCQHCENAPCETVCPVAATVHSAEGLNQQVYNRCVGTRYCANNCPTKVRRFNWFDYPHESATERLVLNPDVVVRSRGVMEKCSMCVQRIQGAKSQAAREGRPLQDGEIATACQQSCPADAIAFGDLNDPNSRVAALVASGRSYRILNELNIGSSVHYLTKIRNHGGEP